MLKITEISDIQKISDENLQKFIEKKADAMFEEYGISSLDEVGCFVILETSEFQAFDISEMEFVEVLAFSDTSYIHGVKVTGDGYGEDIFLGTEVVRC